MPKGHHHWTKYSAADQTWTNWKLVKRYTLLSRQCSNHCKHLCDIWDSRSAALHAVEGKQVRQQSASWKFPRQWATTTKGFVLTDVIPPLRATSNTICEFSRKICNSDSSYLKRKVSRHHLLFEQHYLWLPSSSAQFQILGIVSSYLCFNLKFKIAT